MAANSYRFQRVLPNLAQVLAALVAGFALFVGAVIIWTLGYQLFYAGRIFPGVTVAGVDVSGLEPAEDAAHEAEAEGHRGAAASRTGDEC